MPSRFLIGTLALAALAAIALPRSALAEAPTATTDPASVSAAPIPDVSAADKAHHAFQVGIWRYDLMIQGVSRPGLVIRFGADGRFDGTDTIWTTEGKRVESIPISGTWTVLSLGESRWRVEVTPEAGETHSAVFRRIDDDHVFNEFSGRVADRVPGYADS